MARLGHRLYCLLPDQMDIVSIVQEYLAQEGITTAREVPNFRDDLAGSLKVGFISYWRTMTVQICHDLDVYVVLISKFNDSKEFQRIYAGTLTDPESLPQLVKAIKHHTKGRP